MSDTLKVTVELTYSDDPKNTQMGCITIEDPRHLYWVGSTTPVTLHEHLARELNWIVADWKASRSNAGGAA